MNLEAAVIGIALSGSRIALLDLDVVQPYHFADTRNQAIWRLIESYKADNPSQALDPTLLLDKLPGITDAHVEPDYLLDCLAAAPAAAEALAASYAKKLLDNHAHRNLHDACLRGIQILESGGDPGEAENTIRSLLDQVSSGSTDLVDNEACLDELIDFSIEALPFTPTPWPDVNDMIGGWKPGGLYVIAARPGVGKSIASIQAATELADTGHVYLASLEMSGRELWGRVMANIADVPGDAITRRRQPTPEEQAKMRAAAPILKGLPIHFDERANLTIGDFVATARLLHREHGLKAAFVDYIGLINAAPGEKRARWELIGEYTRTLKNLAKDLQIPVIAVAQLGRQAETRPGGELTLSDLRESGNIEQDANVVCLLSCPNEGGVTDYGRLDFYVAKNREGRTGHALLSRDGTHSRLSHLGWTPSYE